MSLRSYTSRELTTSYEQRSGVNTPLWGNYEHAKHCTMYVIQRNISLRFPSNSKAFASEMIRESCIGTDYGVRIIDKESTEPDIKTSVLNSLHDIGHFSNPTVRRLYN